MKASRLFINLLALTLITCSKEKEDVRGASKCVAVRYTLPYCPVKASIITFLEPQLGLPDPYREGAELAYAAAVLDLPDEFKKTDTVFYLTYHYDPEREKREHAAVGPVMCTANIGLNTLIVGESASWQPCP